MKSYCFMGKRHAAKVTFFFKPNGRTAEQLTSPCNLPFSNLLIGNLPLGKLLKMRYICIIMQTPFNFGRTVKNESFTNREQEIKKLASNFENRINTIIISPRRWGKSSLVEKE